MSFAWPWALVSLLVVPAMLGLHLWVRNRRRKQAVLYSNVPLLRSVLPRRTRWQRHLPIALLLASLAALAFAAGRPQATRNVPYARTSIILALDVSRSMCSTDIQPNRLTAAQAAARQFVQDQPKDTRMGLVVFSGFAELTVPPTTDRDALVKAIDGLTTGPGTAIGAAILKGLDAVAEVNPSVAPVGSDPGKPPSAGKPGSGGYVPDIVVLLTDGANNRGIEPLQAVPYAVARHVRVYTIGFGTTDPAPPVCTEAQLGGDIFDAGGFGGGGGFSGGFGGAAFSRFLVADAPTLEAVAAQTGGTFHSAEDAEQLQKVFAGLPKEVRTQKEREEITWWFAALGGLLALGALAASMRWSAYP